MGRKKTENKAEAPVTTDTEQGGKKTKANRRGRRKSYQKKKEEKLIAAEKTLKNNDTGNDEITSTIDDTGNVDESINIANTGNDNPTFNNNNDATSNNENMAIDEDKTSNADATSNNENMATNENETSNEDATSNNKNMATNENETSNKDASLHNENMAIDEDQKGNEDATTNNKNTAIDEDQKGEDKKGNDDATLTNVPITPNEDDKGNGGTIGDVTVDATSSNNVISTETVEESTSFDNSTDQVLPTAVVSGQSKSNIIADLLQLVTQSPSSTPKTVRQSNPQHSEDQGVGFVISGPKPDNYLPLKERNEKYGRILKILDDKLLYADASWKKMKEKSLSELGITTEQQFNELWFDKYKGNSIQLSKDDFQKCHTFVKTTLAECEAYDVANNIEDSPGGIRRSKRLATQAAKRKTGDGSKTHDEIVEENDMAFLNQIAPEPLNNYHASIQAIAQQDEKNDSLSLQVMEFIEKGKEDKYKAYILPEPADYMLKKERQKWKKIYSESILPDYNLRQGRLTYLTLKPLKDFAAFEKLYTDSGGITNSRAYNDDISMQLKNYLEKFLIDCEEYEQSKSETWREKQHEEYVRQVLKGCSDTMSKVTKFRRFDHRLRRFVLEECGSFTTQQETLLLSLGCKSLTNETLSKDDSSTISNHQSQDDANKSYIFQHPLHYFEILPETYKQMLMNFSKFHLCVDDAREDDCVPQWNKVDFQIHFPPPEGFVETEYEALMNLMDPKNTFGSTYKGFDGFLLSQDYTEDKNQDKRKVSIINKSMITTLTKSEWFPEESVDFYMRVTLRGVRFVNNHIFVLPFRPDFFTAIKHFLSKKDIGPVDSEKVVRLLWKEIHPASYHYVNRRGAGNITQPNQDPDLSADDIERFAHNPLKSKLIVLTFLFGSHYTTVYIVNSHLAPNIMLAKQDEMDNYDQYPFVVMLDSLDMSNDRQDKVKKLTLWVYLLMTHIISAVVPNEKGGAIGNPDMEAARTAKQTVQLNKTPLNLKTCNFYLPKVPIQENAKDCGIYAGINSCAVYNFYEYAENNDIGDDFYFDDTAHVLRLTIDPWYLDYPNYNGELYTKFFRKKFLLLLNYIKSKNLSRFRVANNEEGAIIKAKDMTIIDPGIHAGAIAIEKVFGPHDGLLSEEQKEEIDKRQNVSLEEFDQICKVENVNEFTKAIFKSEFNKRLPPKMYTTVDHMLQFIANTANKYTAYANQKLEDEVSELPMHQEVEAMSTAKMNYTTDVYDDEKKRKSKKPKKKFSNKHSAEDDHFESYGDVIYSFKRYQQGMLHNLCLLKTADYNKKLGRYEEAKKKDATTNEELDNLEKEMKEAEYVRDKVMNFVFPVTEHYGYNYNGRAQQISKMAYNKKTSRYLGMYGEAIWGDEIREEILETEWVEENFKIDFLNQVIWANQNTTAKIWVHVPAGDSRTEDKKNYSLEILEARYRIQYMRHLKMKYQQGDQAYCVACSFASAMHLAQFKDIASHVYQKREDISQMDALSQIRFLFETTTKGRDRLTKRFRFEIDMITNRDTVAKIDPDTLANNSLLFMIPLGVDGGTSHAIVVWVQEDGSKLIVDSNDEHPLAYSRNALNFCCGMPLGYKQVKLAIRIKFRNTKKKKQ